MFFCKAVTVLCSEMSVARISTPLTMKAAFDAVVKMKLPFTSAVNEGGAEATGVATSITRRASQETNVVNSMCALEKNRPMQIVVLHFCGAEMF